MKFQVRKERSEGMIEWKIMKSGWILGSMCLEVWGSVRAAKPESVIWKWREWYLQIQCLKLIMEKLQFNDNEKA